MVASLIYKGAEVAGTESTRLLADLSFAPGDPNTSAQLSSWHGVAIHWTGGERGYEGVRDTLRRARCSIHFVVEKSGRIVQLADLDTICAHIGKPGNRRFLGIEVVCRGFATPADMRGSDLRDRDELDWSESRDVYRDYVGRHRTGFAAFSPEQVRSVLILCETLAGVFGFPRLIPAAPAPKILRTSPLDWSLLVVQHEGKRWVPSMERGGARLAAKHHGALGHFHTHDDKYDPGPQIMYALWCEGWNPAAKKLPGLVRLPA